MFRVQSLLILTIIAIFAGCRSSANNPANSSTTPTPPVAPATGYDPNLTDLSRVKPGTPAPEFELEDLNGKKVRLSDYRGKKYVVLVFYRGYFWPQCVDQVGRLKMLLAPEEKQNVQIIAISNDTHAESRLMLTEISEAPGKFDFLLLEDNGYRVVGRYGIFNPAEFKPGIPYPAVYIIDKGGMVIERFIDIERSSRATNFQIREALQRVGAVR